MADPASGLVKRLGWFAGIWLASVLALAAVGGLIRAILVP